MKIIVGAGECRQNNWISLQRSDLDIRSLSNWLKLFKPNSLDAVLAEHTLEHLTKYDAYKAVTNIYKFLKKGGYFRVAVPDANNPNLIYQDYNKPNGYFRKLLELFQNYQGKEHLEFYNIASLSNLLLNAGFKVNPLEWYSNTGKAYKQNWSLADGIIHRRFNSNYAQMHRILGFENTSLIVDAIKR